MKHHAFESFFTTAINWTPLVPIRAVMPPRDPDEDKENEEDEPPIVRESDED
jgi:hypothetical protein